MNVSAGVVVLLVFTIANISSAATWKSLEISPSPGPSPQPIVAVTDERCSNSSKRTCHDLKSLAACLNRSSSNDIKDLFLLVQNDGEDLLEVNVTILDIDISFPEIQVPKHQAKKIKILANIDGSPSIILNAGNGNCIILIGSMGLDNAFYKKYVTHLSPIHGAYFLFFTALIAGGAWTCFKIGKNEMQVDGVRYQELEMEQPAAADCSANDEEMTVGWNQGWDDDWEEDEEEAQEAKAPNDHQRESVSAMGHTFKASDTNGDMIEKIRARIE